MEYMNKKLLTIQLFLNYDGWISEHFSYDGSNLGKTGTTAFALGILAGVHGTIFLVINILLVLSKLSIASILPLPWLWTIWVRSRVSGNDASEPLLAFLIIAVQTSNLFCMEYSNGLHTSCS